MANILIVSPFSGAKFTGGLAVVNEQLTKALVAENHEVKLLTFQLNEKVTATKEGHGGAEICPFRVKKRKACRTPGVEAKTAQKIESCFVSL